MSEPFFQESTPVPGRRHSVRDGATVGRAGDISLVDPQVSRTHARLRIAGTEVSIEDLGSRNGTFVNEARIDAITVLHEGDTVRMGDTIWRLFAGIPDELALTASGDVPPPDPSPSGVRRVAERNPAEPPSFSEPRRPARRRGSAARVPAAIAFTYGTVAATAVAVGLYLGLR